MLYDPLRIKLSRVAARFATIIFETTPLPFAARSLNIYRCWLKVFKGNPLFALRLITALSVPCLPSDAMVP